MINSLYQRDIVSVNDLSSEQVQLILDTATDLNNKLSPIPFKIKLLQIASLKPPPALDCHLSRLPYV